MDMKRLLRIFLLTLTVGLTPVANALGPSSTALLGAAVSAQFTAQLSARISANEAAETVRQRVGGKVLAVETLQGEYGPIYRIKILTRRAEVRVYLVDAQSGDILE